MLTNHPKTLQFYRTAPYPCAYLPEKQACSQLAGPPFLIDTACYTKLVQKGFRRSGQFAYRPECESCQACISVRVRVQDFSPSRSQRRTLKRHTAVIAKEVPLAFDPAHFALYMQYQKSRHPGQGMDSDDPEQYTQSLLQSQIDTHLICFYQPGGELKMVSVIDCLEDGLSSVYTFFDPNTPEASWGTYNILWQISACQNLGLPYLYLGYWIKESPKMNYKTNFPPLEGYFDGRWQALVDY